MGFHRLKVVPNPDHDKYVMVKEAVKENGGYCPCKIAKNEETKCPCLDFRCQIKPGLCECGLYLKKKVEIEL